MDVDLEGRLIMETKSNDGNGSSSWKSLLVGMECSDGGKWLNGDVE